MVLTVLVDGQLASIALESVVGQHIMAGARVGGKGSVLTAGK
jgi:hypothetical protein